MSVSSCCFIPACDLWRVCEQVLQGEKEMSSDLGVLIFIKRDATTLIYMRRISGTGDTCTMVQVKDMAWVINSLDAFSECSATVSCERCM